LEILSEWLLVILNKKIKATRAKVSERHDKSVVDAASHRGFICYTRGTQVPYYRSQFPAAEWDEKWMDEYLDDTVKLLDICLVALH